MVLFRLSLVAYRLRRVVGVEGTYSRILVAARGITAGSGFATSELRVLLIDVIEVAPRWWPRVQLALYVDDLTIAASGVALVAAGLVAEVVNFVVKHFEQHLQLEVSAAKSVVVGSKVSVARTVAGQMRCRELAPKRSAKALGVPVGGGRRRSVRVPCLRLSVFKARLGRLMAFRRA